MDGHEQRAARPRGAEHDGDGEATGEHHDHAPVARGDNRRSVLLALVLTLAFMGVEAVGGVLSGSLALIADAGHMLTDAAALLLAWAGFHFARRAASTRRTFGYLRLEVLAGFVNALLLFLLVAWVTWEAFGRLREPSPVLAGPMLVVAVAGLLVNLLVFRILHQADTEHVNIQGALVHVLGDLLGSVAAIVAAVVIHFTGWTPIDPLLSVLILLLILRSAWALLKNSIHILLEGTPADIDVEAVEARLVAKVAGLHCVEHVHVWSITSGQPAATLEAHIQPDADPRVAIRAIKEVLAHEFGVVHSTVEIVWDEGEGCVLEAVPQRHAHPHP